MSGVFPLVHGDLAEQGPIDLLKLCEETRFTGLIEVAAKGLGGSLQLRGGEIETMALEGVAADPLDAFLALTAGRYTLRQQMPTLEGGLSNDRLVRGSIANHSPADVLRFCEGAGLTGEARLSSGKRRVEVLYEAGQITTIKLDGKTDADLEEAWGWTTGEFVVTARPLFEEKREAPRPDETGQFLRVVQVALTKVMEGAQKVRERTDTQQRPIPLVTRKKRAPAPRADQTVQVYFLEDVVPETSLSEPAPSTTRHARKDITVEIVEQPTSSTSAALADTALAIEQAGPAKRTAGAADAAPTHEAVASRAETDTAPSLEVEASRMQAVAAADTAPSMGAARTADVTTAPSVAARSPGVAAPAGGRESQTPVWVWIALGASIGGVVVALLAQVIR